MQVQTNSQTLQAKKIKAMIDQSGKLIITDNLNLEPGEVEVIILQTKTISNQSKTSPDEQREDTKQSKSFPSKVKAFQALFDNTQPVPPDFDEDQAKWEALKEKHNL